MDSLLAEVLEIESFEDLNIVRFSIYDQILSMMSLALEKKINVGSKVKLSIKPSHLALAKNLEGEVSYSNQLPCKIVSLQNGQLLCHLKLKFFDTNLESIITQSSATRMELKVGDDVIALIKASEISISEVIA